MANEPLRGKRMVEVTECKRKVDCSHFIKRISDEMYPEVHKITPVTDNFKTYTPGALYEAFAPEEGKRIWDRFGFVYTPNYGRWPNMAEIEFHALNRHIATMEEIERKWRRGRNTITIKML